MRILHLIDSGGVYGAERVLLNLARCCQKLGDEVFVGTIVGPGDVGDPLGSAAVREGLSNVKFPMRDGFSISGVRSILRFARAEAIEVIHTHGYKANVMLAATPPKGRTFSTVATMHGWTAVRRTELLWWYEVLDRLLARRLDRVVAVSQRIRDTLATVVPPQQLELIHNGIEIPPGVCAIAGGKSGRASLAEPLRILAAGRLSYEKGFDSLLYAVADLRSEGEMFEVRVAGSGPMLADLNALVAKLGLSDCVQLLGYQESLCSQFQEADLFVLPSRSEGLPLVLLEAMVRRVPVVATPVGEVPDVLEHGRLGWLASTNEHHDLAGALRQAMSDIRNSEQVDSVLHDASQAVKHLYSVENMAQRYRQVYREVARPR